MTDMKALARLMKELEDQLVVCMRCGMCQAVCPLFEQTGREADVARGKLALLDGLMQEMFRDAEGTYERLNRCLLCGSCAANCPSGVSVLEIFLKARAILTGYVGLSPAKRILFRGMLARPKLFDRIAEWGAKLQKLFTKPVNDVMGTSCARVMSPLLSDRHFVPLAEKPFHKILPQLNEDPKAGRPKVLFFVGCLIDKIFPNVAEASIRALRHHEVGIVIPRNMGCCGIPALSSGDLEAFKRLVIHNLSCFESVSFDYLITACATCTATIKKIWPVMMRQVSGMSPEILSKVAALSDKTMDISWFLVWVAGASPRPLSNSDKGKGFKEECVTYHDPCHLKKSLGISEEPRILLRTNPDYRFKEMPASDWCCGMGGSFNLSYYEISDRIGKKKRDAVLSTGCKTVATSCPACMLQISDMLSKSNQRIRVRHAIEIYARTLDDRKTSFPHIPE